MSIRIGWVRCDTYEDARRLAGVYLHERAGRSIYWGKAEKTFGERYRLGYKHWIEICLENGSRLYVGVLQRNARSRLVDVERTLILQYGSVMNKHKLQPSRKTVIRHAGEIPRCIRRKMRSKQVG
jgi:hypothetical protein